MKAEVIISKIRSGVIHIEIMDKNSRILSGSGFILEKYLVTNNHLYSTSLLSDSCDTIKLSWQPDLSVNSLQTVELEFDKWRASLKSGSDENNFDYAILDIDELKDKDIYNFKIYESKNVLPIGNEALLLGYPLEHSNLVCHRAYISSYFLSHKTEFIQLDASVNVSNSGGPLVDICSGDVIGIITRKGTGLTKLFDELLSTFDGNVDVLKQATSTLKISGIDPVEALIASQNQMKRLAEEIERSANVGIGYAVSINHLRFDLDALKQ